MCLGKRCATREVEDCAFRLDHPRGNKSVNNVTPKGDPRDARPAQERLVARDQMRDAVQRKDPEGDAVNSRSDAPMQVG